MSLSNGVGVLTLGAVTGLGYGLLGIGLVLVFRASRFVNFAHAQLGVVGSVLLARLVLGDLLPYPLALIAALAAAAGVGALIERTVVRRLFGASRLVLLVAMVGVSQLIVVATLLPPLRLSATDNLQINSGNYPVPFNLRLRIGSQVLNSSEVVMMIAAPIIATALFTFFARTELGRSIRAAASNPEAASLAGISVRRMSLIVWVIAGLLSGLTAILQAPKQGGFDVSALGPVFLLKGLAAALLGGMIDFRTAFGAGVLLGIVEQGMLYNFSQVAGIGPLSVMAFILLGVILHGRTLAKSSRRGDDLLGVERSQPVLSEALRATHVFRHLNRYGWAALIGVLAIAPVLPGLETQSKAQNLTLILAFAIVGVSISLLTGWAGQVSLGHFAILGVGAYAAARADAHHLSFPAMVLIAGVAAGVAAVLIGLPALRFRGLFLAVCTLAFAVVAPVWLFVQGWLGESGTGNATIGGGSADRIAHLPGFGGIHSKRGFYYVALGVLILVLLAARGIRASSIGRAMVAVRDNETAAAADGIAPLRTKAGSLALSGFLAGTGGAVWACAMGGWSSQAFDSAEVTTNLTMLSLTLVGGLGTLAGPVIGAFAVFGVPFLVAGYNTVVWRAAFSGVLLLAALLFMPNGLMGLVTRVRDRLFCALDGTVVETEGARGTSAGREVVRTSEVVQARRCVSDRPPLVADRLSVRFGGVLALDEVTITVAPGEIVGLIGGNGAGKTTLMNCISGHVQADRGSIQVHGDDVTGMPPHARPGAGVARTFQDAYLYPGLTVAEAVLLPFDRLDRSRVVGAMTHAPWVRFAERRKRVAAIDVLERLGLAGRGETLTSDLSTGMRRLCSLASATAAQPGLILLDEPTAGIAQREVEAFGPLLRAMRDELGAAVLLVEHDMPLMFSLCDRIYCMQAGRVIAHGTPDDIASDPAVIASYLGTDQAAVARSGAPRGGRANRPVRQQPLEARR